MVDINYTVWQPDTCDCEITFSWDRDLPPDQRVHKLYEINHRCSEHIGLSDEATLWQHVKEQNTRKNHAPEIIAEALGYIDTEGYPDINRLRQEHQLSWNYTGYDEFRVLHYKISNTNKGERNSIQRDADGFYGTNKLIIED